VLIAHEDILFRVFGDSLVSMGMVRKMDRESAALGSVLSTEGVLLALTQLRASARHLRGGGTGGTTRRSEKEKYFHKKNAEYWHSTGDTKASLFQHSAAFASVEARRRRR
jgi:hypothetical protein